MLTAELLKRNLDRLARWSSGRHVLFHHVPKCAGTSVSRGLRIRYALSQASIAAPATADVVAAAPRYSSLSEDEQLNELRKFRIRLLQYYLWQDYRFVGGHVPFSDAAYNRYRTRYKFITVLREPVERFISQYYFDLHRDHHARVEVSLDEYLETRTAWITANRYSEYFCGHEAFAPDDTEANVRAAVDNLEKFDVVGFTDRMNDFSRRIKETLGVSVRFRRARVARTPTSARARDIAPHTRKKIERLCAADLEIFESARRRFAGRPY